MQTFPPEVTTCRVYGTTDTVSTHTNSSDQDREDTSPHQVGSAIGERKAHHLDICIREDRYQVESGSTGLDGVRFIHAATPELSLNEIRTETTFLETQVRLPIFISSMTGGSEAGYRANKQLAEAAQITGIPVGMGSIRILFRKPDVIDHFRLKRYAPDVPVFANLGGVQLKDTPHDKIHAMVRTLEVDAVAIHLNPAQELFQPGGDTDFTGVLNSLERFIATSPVPVIVKETGFGIHPALARKILDMGAVYVDCAGTGGTNWVLVEAHRQHRDDARAAEEFTDWGLPTGILLDALDTSNGRVLASGGLRTGMDIAKCLALGASSCGLALPLIRAVHRGGAEEAVRYIRHLETTLRSVMLLTGSKTVEDLRRGRIMKSREFVRAVEELRNTADPTDHRARQESADQ
jgi:isopentenyl-diphosphate Delta-isomerase